MAVVAVPTWGSVDTWSSLGQCKLFIAWVYSETNRYHWDTYNGIWRLAAWSVPDEALGFCNNWQIPRPNKLSCEIIMPNSSFTLKET